MQITEKTFQFGDPRLGWLEAFAFAAERRSYTDAKQEIGIDPTNAERAVSKLEGWLHKPLTMSSHNGFELSSFGERLVPDAQKIFRMLSDFCAASAKPTGDDKSVRFKSQLSLIRLSDLHSFLVIAKSGSFQRAAHYLNVDPTSAQRIIKSIEKACGKRLIVGFSRIGLSEDGKRFCAIAKRIIVYLMRNRVEISDDVLKEHRARSVQRFVSLLTKRTNSYINVAETAKRIGGENAQRIELAKFLLNGYRVTGELLENEWGPLPSVSAKNISFDPMD